MATTRLDDGGPSPGSPIIARGFGISRAPRGSPGHAPKSTAVTIFYTARQLAADLLQIERELGRIRDEIERMDGRMRSWDNLLATSTLTLDTRVAYVAAAPAGLGDRVASR
jgi:hypothetical protein